MNEASKGRSDGNQGEAGHRPAGSGTTGDDFARKVVAMAATGTAPATAAAWQAGSDVVLNLPRSLTLEAAEELREQLVAALGSAVTVRLVADAVDSISRMAAQHLLAYSTIAQRRGARLVIDRPSAAVIEALDSLGLRALVSAADPASAPPA